MQMVVQSSFAQTASSEQLTQRTDTWGDWYGITPSIEMPTTVCNYYYDNNNRMVCSISLTNLAGDSESTKEIEKEGDQYPNEFLRYYYDEQGNMVKKTKRKYGFYNNGYMGWDSSTSVEETYAYDANGHLVWTHTDGGYSHQYTWDGDNLVERNDTTGYGNWTQQYVYTDFLAGFTNLPQTVYTISRYGQKYKGVYVYDEQGRPVTYTETSITSATVDDNHHMTDIELSSVPYSQTTYEYDTDGLSTSILSYWNNSHSAFEPSKKTEEKLRSDGGIEKTVYSYSRSSESWAKNGSPTVSYNVTYTKNSAPTNISFEILNADDNEFKLTADAPTDLTGNEIWKVYRNGQYEGRATLENGKIVYTNSLISNGDWVYFIQRATESDTTGINVTDLLDVTLAAPVPGPRNLHVASCNVSGKNHRYKMAWSKPEPCSHELLGYNVYSDLGLYSSNPLSLNEEGVITDTTYTITWSADEDEGDGLNHTFYVEAVYELGTSGLGQPLAVVLGQESKRLITSKKTMGDTMGTVGEDVASKITTYFYDNNNHLVRETYAGRLDDDNPQTPNVVEKAGDYQVTKYKMYNYDENENLTEVLQMEYTVNQGVNMSWTEPDTLEAYQYDANNHCIAMEGEGRSYEYVWDGDNKTQEKQYSTGTNKLLYTISYSDFVEGRTNLPQKAIKDGSYTSNQRIYEYTYDEAGNKITANTYKFGEVSRDADGNITSVTNGDAEYAETWTYDDNGYLTLYLKQKWNADKGEWINNSKTEYTQTEDGEKEITYSWTSGTDIWTSGLPNVNTYKEYYENTAPTNFTVAIVEDELNTASLSATAPTEKFDNPSYYVYRNGVNIGKADMNSLYTKTSYTDKEVENGTWDYFLISNTDALNMANNIATPVTITFNTALQPVTNVWETASSVKDKNYYLSVAWEAPVSDIPLIGYNIYSDIKSYTKNPAPDNDINIITDTAYDYTWSTEGEATKEVYVEAVYSIGRIRSEKFSFTVDLPEAIDQVKTSSDDTTLSLAGRQLTVNGSYKTLRLYDTKGISYGVWTNTQNIDLAKLSAGAYIIKMNTVNGQSKSYKLVLK